MQIQNLQHVYFSTITFIQSFPINALFSTPSLKNGGRKRFNAYISRTGSRMNKIPNTKTLLRLFLHKNVPMHFPRKRITWTPSWKNVRLKLFKANYYLIDAEPKPLNLES